MLLAGHTTEWEHAEAEEKTKASSSLMCKCALSVKRYIKHALNYPHGLNILQSVKVPSDWTKSAFY